MSDLSDLAADFRAAASALTSELETIAGVAGQKIKNAALENAPRTVGRSSINYEVESSPREVSVSVESSSEFGAILEFGTPTNPGGSPFMGPAFDDEVPNFEKFSVAAAVKALS